jgi:outer membrane protein assembly factor BamB
VKSHLIPPAVAAAAVLLFGGTCGPRLHPPEYVSLPASVFSGDTAWVRLATSGSGYGTVRYVVEWANAATETTGQFRLSDTATVWHVWTSLDTKYVRAAVYPIDDPQRIKWAVQKRIIVEAGGTHAPVIDTVEAPPLVMRGVEVYFTVKASDPDGDSIKIHIDWGNGKDTANEFHGAPYYFGFYPAHTFTQVETAKVIVTARDSKGATSLPETVLVRVDTIGGVLWYAAAPWSSPLVVNDGFEDCVYFMPRPGDDPGGPTGFLALTTAGDHKYSEDSGPSSTAAYCAATQHIVGWGRCFSAVDRQLHLAWRLSTPDSTDYSHWTDLAVGGDRIYVGDKDSLFCFIDSVDHGVRAAVFVTSMPINNAPAVDAQGNVYFGTDSGFLYKAGPGLDTMFWRTRFAAGSIYSPVVGSEGTIFCASDASCVYAVDPATGTSIWTVTLLGAPGPLALGRTAIFVATGGGTAYSIDPATGHVNWTKRLTADQGISSAPAAAADGYVYFVSNDDVLYRVSQMDGTLDWAYDCGYFGGGIEVSYPGKRMPSTANPSNSTILPNGNIIVAGRSALYCVAGSHAGPLDPLAPWPKWQHDLHNSGSVGGGK